jgi:hypothetical protein
VLCLLLGETLHKPVLDDFDDHDRGDGMELAPLVLQSDETRDEDDADDIHVNRD